MNSLHVLPAGHTITASIVDGSGFIRQVENPLIGSRVTNAASVSFGPYALPRQFTTQGALVVEIAEADTLPSVAQKTMLDHIPASDPADGETVYSDDGVLKVSTASA